MESVLIEGAANLLIAAVRANVDSE